jgi:hypothetical protein
MSKHLVIVFCKKQGRQLGSENYTGEDKPPDNSPDKPLCMPERLYIWGL